MADDLVRLIGAEVEKWREGALAGRNMRQGQDDDRHEHDVAERDENEGE